MSAQDIRLRLVIRRHALPEVKLVWPCVATDDLTISGLLTQVNEVVPLESGEWGLEDYAVELSDSTGSSFECLHFQQVVRTLKQDDQVVIRSLLGDDLKRRRLSGRHQISAGGKHLVDGIAFGRPWLKAPRDRPAILLPPRKRQRMTYDPNDDEEEDQDEEDSPQLLLGAPESMDDLERGTVGVEAAFLDADQDEDEDDEFEPEDDAEDDALDEDEDDNHDGDDDEMGDEDLNDELELLKKDNDLVDDDPVDLADPTITSIKSRLGTDSHGLSIQDRITALLAAFPLTPIPRIETELLRQHKDLERAYVVLAKSNDPELSFEEMMEAALEVLPEPGLLPELSPEPLEDVALGDLMNGSKPKPNKPLIQEVESVEPGPASPPLIQDADADATSESDLESEDSEEDSDGESSDGETSNDSSSEGESKDSDSDSDDSDESDEQPAKEVPEPSKDSDDPDESSSDDSSSDDPDSSDLSDAAGGAELSENDSSNTSDSDSSDSDSDSDSGSEPEKAPSKPIASKTKPLIQVVQSIPATPAETQTENPTQPGQGLTKTQRRNARRRERMKAIKNAGTAESNPSADTAALDQELLSRKQALLTAVSEEAPDVEMSGKDGTEVMESEPAQTPDVQTAPEKRRSRMDLGAGRRLLFGALGLKNPKTKDDEKKLRDKLMQDVRPLPNARLAETSEQTNEEQMNEDEDLDSWKSKIVYRAVECCYEGMVLSEPPFPFVQRWDPQQQYGSMRKRKRQSQNYDYDNSYYDDSQMYDQEAEPAQRSSKKSKAQKPDDGPLELNYDEPPKTANDSQYTEPDDLPVLPSDVSTLPFLDLAEIRPGMVITWKQLLLSKATNWQPEIASMSALVLPNTSEDTLHVVLAKRDREQSEKVYDETGTRIYDKFEVPDMDEDDEDDGHRDIAWSEMIEPRLVQREPSPGLSAGPSPSKSIAAVPDEAPAIASLEAEDSNMPDATDAAGHSNESSIQPGQAIPLQASGDDSASPSLQSWEKPTASNDRVNSPTRQLQETSQQAASLRRSQSQASQPGESAPSIHNAGSGQASLLSHDPSGNMSPVRETEAVSLSQAIESLDKLLPDHEKPEVPTSQLSIPSGRQPQPGEIGDSLGSIGDSVIPETLLDAHDSITFSNDVNDGHISSRSSSPFPSLEEIYHTASSSRQTQDSAKAGLQSVKSKVKSDPAYEDAMRRIDEGDESDSSPSRDASIRRLFPNATQPLPSTEDSTTEQPRAQTPIKTKKRTRTKRSSPFQVPAGSQVVELESSPNSAQFTENYAEEDIDGTYEDKGKLPQGSGWVKKHAEPKKPLREREVNRKKAVKVTGRKSMPPSAETAAKVRRVTRSIV